MYFPSGKKGDSFATENTGLTACEIHRNVSKNVLDVYKRQLLVFPDLNVLACAQCNERKAVALAH